MPAFRRPPRARRRVRAAGRADGAAESGPARLLRVDAAHMTGDAMIAVSLAGTSIVRRRYRNRGPAAPTGSPELPTTPVGPSWS